MTITCSRTLEFDAAHRIPLHESKCAHLHGHRYKVEFTASADLDAIGRVVDFGAIKHIVGAWLDANLDHGTILNKDDVALVEWLSQFEARAGEDQKLYLMDVNPTAENLAALLLDISNRLLAKNGAPDVKVVGVRVWETPNCYADARA